MLRLLGMTLLPIAAALVMCAAIEILYKILTLNKKDR
jgi:hypothetical protein